MKIKGKWVILAGAVVVAGLFAVFGLNRGAQAQHFTAKVERGEIDDVVEATGTINAVITVQVGSQVSGTIAKLNADFNSRVHKGDIVALIPALFRGSPAGHGGFGKRQGQPRRGGTRQPRKSQGWIGPDEGRL